MLTISRAEIQADWVFVSDVTKSTFTAAVGNSVKLT
jgi:hypothetical protein